MFEELFHEAVNRAEWQLIILAIIIIAGPLIAERFKLPGMIGLVLGGLILGPYVLNWLREGSLDALGGIGLLFLMFMAGVELDLNLFQRYRSVAITFGLITFTLPFLFNIGASIALGLSLMGAILMGSVWASHTLVAYGDVRQAGLASNKAVAVTVGATVITDTLSLIVLAVVSAIAGGGESGGEVNPAFIVVKLVLGLIVLVGYCLYLLPRLGRWFFSGLGQDRLLRFVFVIGALSSAGFLSALVGIEGLVGAFFAGLGLNRLIPNNGQLMERVEFFSASLFVPAFLISVGMLINPRVLFLPKTMLIALVFFLALGAGKYLAAWLAGRRNKFSSGEIGLMFSLTIAQAAATLASTMVGLRLGLFGEQIVNAVLLVVLVSLILTSVGVNVFSKRIQPETLTLKPIGRSVIVPVEANGILKQLVSTAGSLALADAGIVTPVAVVPEHLVKQVRPEAEELLEQAEQYAAAAATDAEGVLRIDDSLPQGIIRELNQREGSLILVGWEHLGAKDMLFGNSIDRIGSRSPVPVAAATFSDHPTERLVLVPGVNLKNTGYLVDLSVALDIAVRLKNIQNLPLVTFSPEPELPGDLKLPDGAEYIHVEPGLEAIATQLRLGDLVIVPGAILRRAIGSDVQRLANAINGIGLIVAAGPYRLNLTSAEFSPDAKAMLPISTSG
jgi:Kef-type K+ transport system membrane component KefB